MGNCCSSKKREDVYDAEDLNEVPEGEMTIGRGGLLGQFAPSKELDELMFEYIDEHLPESLDEMRDAVGMIKFDYFLKLYKSAIVWNRVKFAEKKKEMLARRR
jgi:hypothetical protein